MVSYIVRKVSSQNAGMAIGIAQSLGYLEGMASGRRPIRIVLTDEERAALDGFARRATIAYSIRVRPRIVLLASEGLPARVIGERVGVGRMVVNKWRQRFINQRLDGLYDAVHLAR
jgi:hypothetical protein